MTEGEIFALAPSSICDRVHWSLVDEVDLVGLLPALEASGIVARTRHWSDGQQRIWVDAGLGHQARERVLAWCQEQGIETFNMRVESGVPFRDVDSIPDGLFPELVAAAVEWLYPRIASVRHRMTQVLESVTDEDIRSMLYLFISDHADRYDDDRAGINGPLNFLSFILGKVRTWPQDMARSTFGRGVANDRVALHQAVQRLTSDEGRPPTELERAMALGTTVTDLRRREAAIAAMDRIRWYEPLGAGGVESEDGFEVQIASSDNVETSPESYARAASVTRAVLEASAEPHGRGDADPLALAAIYLAFWEDLSKADVARELDTLPKTANAAITRVTKALDPEDFA